MNRILLASVALLGLSGVAAAEPPALHGNYSTNVLNRYNDTTLGAQDRLDMNATAAIRDTTRSREHRSTSRAIVDARSSPAEKQKQRDYWELYSGR